MKKNKIILLLIISIIYFFYQKKLLFKYGLLTDNDSHTYSYLINPDMPHSSFFQTQRPIVFPFYLYILSFFKENSSQIYLINNYMMYSLSILITSLFVYKITDSIILSLIAFLVYGVNLQILSLVNYSNPEVLLVFVLNIHILIFWKFLSNKTSIWAFLLFVSFSFLTFIKPIFLFYPLVAILLIVYFLKKENSFKNKVKKSANLASLQNSSIVKLWVIYFLFILFYFIPVILWVYNNDRTNNAEFAHEVQHLGKI